MNILMLGWGAKPGSFQIRGVQLGAALGARVTSTPSADDWRWADLAVIVKRSEPRFGPDARANGVPIVWDALDCWRQPAENGCDETGGRAILQAHIMAIRPVVTIGATQAQADAAGGVYLPHHSWPGLEPTPPREHVQTVAYQGNAAYLGNWLGIVSRACQARGWRFVVNPDDLRDADILVAFRDGPWDGWMCREWKSGVKLVNAIAAGRPILCQQSAAYREIVPPGSIVETVEDLQSALDIWTSYEARHAAMRQCLMPSPFYQLSAIAERYRAILQQAMVSCAA